MLSSQVSATLKNLVFKPEYEINSSLVVYVDIHVFSVRGAKTLKPFRMPVTTLVGEIISFACQ